MSEQAGWPCGQGHRVEPQNSYCRSCDAIGKKAENWLYRFLYSGIGLAVLAGIILAASWPGVVEDCDYFDDDCVEGAVTGSDGGVTFGWIVFGIADTLILVALLGFAVRLGVRAARAEAR